MIHKQLTLKNMIQKGKTTLIGLTLLLFVMNSNAQDRPMAVIVAEKMNVLYAGTPNPVSVAGSVPYKKLHIDWGGATAILLGNGRYDIYVPDTLRFITISVSAELKKGKIVNLGSSTFRVKPVPPPYVYVGANILSGEHKKELILVNPLLAARMPPEFNYHMRLQVLSYKVTFICDEDEPIIVNGHLFGDKVKEKIQKAPSGTIVVFSDIKVQSIAGELDIKEQIIITIK